MQRPEEEGGDDNDNDDDDGDDAARAAPAAALEGLAFDGRGGCGLLAAPAFPAGSIYTLLHTRYKYKKTFVM